MTDDKNLEGIPFYQRVVSRMKLDTEHETFKDPEAESKVICMACNRSMLCILADRDESNVELMDKLKAGEVVALEGECGWCRADRKNAGH